MPNHDPIARSQQAVPRAASFKVRLSPIAIARREFGQAWLNCAESTRFASVRDPAGRHWGTRTDHRVEFPCQTNISPITTTQRRVSEAL